MKNLFHFLIAGTVGLVVLISYYFYSLPVSSSRLAQLHSGILTNEVVLVLGKPLEVREMSDGGKMWIYESYVHFFAIEVFFDDSGHFTKYWKD